MKRKSNERLVKVLPADISKLHDGDTLIVNRVSLNSRLVILQLQNSGNHNQGEIQIIRNALGEMLVEEEKRKCVMPGATMVVKDIKKIFPDMNKIPRNSFAQIKV